MRSRSVVLGYALAVVISAVFAFLFVRGLDTLGPVWNGGWQLRIAGEATPRIPADELYRRLDRLAVEDGLEVVRALDDSEHPATVRHLYAAGGGEAGAWLRDGYAPVDTALTTTVAPLIDLGQLDVRGMYLVGDDRSDAEAVLAVIEDAGWNGFVAPYVVATEIDSYRDHGDLMRALAVAFLAILVLVGAGTVLRSRAHGVQRLHGAGLVGILLREWRALAVPVAVLTVAGVGALVGALLLAGALAQVPTLLVLFVRLVAILLPSAVAAHIIGIALTDGRRLVDQVKGEIDGWWILVGVYAVRIPAVLVLLAVVAALGQSARVAEVEARTREFWSVAGDAITLGIAGFRSREEVDGQIPELARLASAQADAGELVLAQFDGVGEGRVLFVNEGYLDRIEVLDAQGQRITRVRDDAVTVLVPEGASSSRREESTATVEGLLDIQAQVSDGVSQTAALPLVTQHTAPQTLFTFRSATAGLNSLDARLADPVIAVLPSIDVLGPSELFASITQGSVIFTDPEAVSREVRERSLSDMVASIEPIAYRANEEYHRALGTLSINLLGLVGGGAVVLLTGLVAAGVTVEKDRRRAFVHHFSGLPPLSAHRGALLLEAVLLSAVTAFALVPLWFRDPTDVRTVLDLAAPDVEVVLAGQTAIGLAVTIVSAGLFVGALGLAHQRATRAGPGDA